MPLLERRIHFVINPDSWCHRDLSSNVPLWTVRMIPLTYLRYHEGNLIGASKACSAAVPKTRPILELAVTTLVVGLKPHTWTRNSIGDESAARRVRSNTTPRPPVSGVTQVASRRGPSAREVGSKTHVAPKTPEARMAAVALPKGPLARPGRTISWRDHASSGAVSPSSEAGQGRPGPIPDVARRGCYRGGIWGQIADRPPGLRRRRRPGQELEVFWDYEPDRRIIEEERWADLAASGFDDPRQFAAFLNTLRWSCVTATDPNLFQSPFRAGIKIDAYQMEPLRKALRLPRVNLFIADDTGLGKTIEAGLIARELLLRKKAKTIVVAAPPSVLEQWKAELEERFGLTFEILDRAYFAGVRRERGFGVNPWRTHSRFLVSHNLLIDPAYADPMREWLGQLLPGSLLILDEAHHAAPSSGGRYGIETKFTRAVRDLGGRFEHRLFLSATPHNGHSNSFSTLLELLDPYRFTRGVKVRGKRALEEVMVRRLKEDIREVQGRLPEAGRRGRSRSTACQTTRRSSALAPARRVPRPRASSASHRHLQPDAGGRRAARRRPAAAAASSIEAFARSLEVHRRTVNASASRRRRDAAASSARDSSGSSSLRLLSARPG